MLGGAVAVGEPAGAFHDDVDAEIAPGKLLGIGLGKHGEVVAVGLEVTVGGAHLAGEAAMHGVELEQMGVHLGRAEIVDRHEIEVLAARFEESPSVSLPILPESVDGDALIRHVSSLFGCANQVVGRGLDCHCRDSEVLIKLLARS